MTRAIVVGVLSLVCISFANGQAAPPEPGRVVVHGSAVDASSGVPIEEFSVMVGHGSVENYRLYFRSDQNYAFSGGEFELEIQFDPQAQSPHVVQVEADDHEALVLDVPIERDRVHLEVKLQRAHNIGGQVILPNGKPAAGAVVLRGFKNSPPSLEWERAPQDSNVARAITDANGRFSVRPTSGDFLMVVTHDAGFAAISSNDHKAEKPIQLHAWGRVEGTVMSGAEPVASAHVVMRAKSSVTPPRGNRYSATTADARGRFVMERVAPGRATIGYYVDIDGVMASTSNVDIDVQPGKTTTVQVGGRGRPVTGQVVVTDEMKKRLVMAHGAILWDSAKAEIRNVAPVEDDGFFCFTDVAPGSYRLQVSLMRRKVPRDADPAVRWHPVMIASCDVTVPEMPEERSDEPVDVGEIEPRKHE